MAVLNIQIVNASLADIQGGIGAGIDDGGWISTSYLIAEIMVIPLSGWLAQVFGPHLPPDQRHPVSGFLSGLRAGARPAADDRAPRCLFRLPFHDVAQQVLQLAADLAAQTGLAPGASEGLRVAEKVYDRIAGRFGLNIVTPLLCYADGNALSKSGYILVAGAALDEATASRMVAMEDKLLLERKRVSEMDYCLLAIEHTATLLPTGPGSINPLTQLGFHRRWQEVALTTMKGNHEQAEEQMLNLRADVITSPELAENDRLIAIGAYETSFDKLKERMAPRNSYRSARDALPSQLSQSLSTVPGVEDAPHDPDKLFALEAAELKKHVRQAPSIDANAARSLARVLNQAATQAPGS